MTTTDKSTFDRIIAERCPSYVEPREVRDVEYWYHYFDDADGNEVGFISYKTGEEPSYTIIEPGNGPIVIDE